MKKNLHPTNYRPVVFSDEVAGFAFLTRSTADSKETIKWEDGNEYPLVKMHISVLLTHSLLVKKKSSTPKVVLIDSNEHKKWLLLVKKLWQTKLKNKLLKKLKKLNDNSFKYKNLAFGCEIFCYLEVSFRYFSKSLTKLFSIIILFNSL